MQERAQVLIIGGGIVGCAREDAAGQHYCAITCTADGDCPYDASCDMVTVHQLGFGLCGYNPPASTGPKRA